MNADHYEQVLAAARAGKHILSDKPLAMNSKQAEEMVAVCKENNVQLSVNYVYRFHPLIEKSRELIENQTIGKLLSVNANFNTNLPPDDNFRFHKDLSGGGVMRDLGTHMIDLLRFLNGEVEPISCVMDNLLYRIEVEDFATALLRFTNGGYATFNVSSNAARAFNRLEILGTKGSINIENLIGGRFSSARMTIILEGERKLAFRKRTNRMHRVLKNVTVAFSKGIPPAVTGEDGLINMRIMEQLEAYAKK
jgi:predicted dehydrogenase